MEHKIKRGETIVVLTMTEDEFLDLYEHFPSRYVSSTADAAKKIDAALASIVDELDKS